MKSCIIRVIILLGFSLLQTKSETKLQLLLDSDEAQVGESIWAGIHFQLSEGWHTYWKYGGEVAQPPEIIWKLPKGISVGNIHWPIPEKLEKGIVSYVYHHETMLMVPISISSGEGKVEINAEVQWLECEELCVQKKTNVSASLILGKASKASIHAGLINEWRGKVPPVDLSLPISFRWENEGDDERNLLIFSDEPKIKLMDFYPHGFEEFEVRGKTDRVQNEMQNGIRKAVFKYEGDWKIEVSGLLKMIVNDEMKWVETSLNLKDKDEYETSQTSETSYQTSKATFLKMLIYAFIGGFILNFMPCVLPVIALKILGFVKQSDESPKKVRQMGLLYGLGVMLSFWILAGLVIGTQQAGRLANWGMQFQSLGFLVPMTILITLVSLNFFGVFEVRLGNRMMGAADQLSRRQGRLGAFFNGVLATILATPCVAPFLAVALGFAFAQPPFWIVIFFTTAAIGLAFPYVLLSWNPNWLKYLPKPGQWLGHFKVAMGFPMLATAVWLYSLTLNHFPEGDKWHEWWMGFSLVLVAFTAWIWGQFVQKTQTHKALSVTLALLFGSGVLWILEYELHWRSPLIAESKKDEIIWKTWSPEAVDEARKKGHPVLVDFTAKWCQNCQFNKRTSIEIDPVREKLKSMNAFIFKADFTHYDEKIAQELKKYDRAGVPLVLIFSANSDDPPQVLPPLLTPKIVLDALQNASQKL